MQKIININYQNRSISLEEDALTAFQNYESELNAYFATQDCGEEIMQDLKNRMAEIFEEKLNAGQPAITLSDIDELKANIGHPSDFAESDADQEPPSSSKEKTNEPFEKKRLFRNKFKDERVIAGVCSGIAHYFSMDPIAVRIVFVLVTLFNMATLFSFNLGILAYIVLWVVLPQEYAKSNIQQKLFRNPKDKVLAGVCSGLSQFFNTETWIIRTVFLLPLLISIFSSHSFFKFHFLGSSLGSIMFMLYIVLWIITPLAKSSTDFMLLKGEPINLATIQKPLSMASVTNDAKSTMNTIFKVLAYIFIAIGLAVFIPTCFGFLVAGFFTFNIVNIILFTSLLKTLGWMALVLTCALPILGLIIWVIRKIAGYRKPNRILRSLFGILWLIGIASGVIVAFSLINELKVGDGKRQEYAIPTQQDTIFIQPTETSKSMLNDNLFDLGDLQQVVNINASMVEIKAIKLRYKEGSDTTTTLTIERFARGKNNEEVLNNIDLISYEPRIEGNTIYLPSKFNFPKNHPYRFQRVRITVYLPKNKVLIVSEELKKQLKYRLNVNENGINISSSDNTKREVIHFGNRTTTITTNWDDENDQEVIRINRQQEVEQSKQDLKEQLREAEDQLKEAQRRVEDSKRETQRQMDDAQRELEKAQQKVQRQIEEAKRLAQ